MTATLSLSAVFAAGLLGSAHCAGMCGGFALALGALPGTRTFALRLAAYLLGKTLTYAVLGALAGVFGWSLFLLAPLQKGFGVGAGLLIVGLGVGLCRGARAPVGHGGAWLVKPLQRLVQRGTLASALGLGLLNGLLPCGLVMAFLAQAGATGSPAQGALTLGVLGVATMPALVLTGSLGRLAGPVLRRRLQVAGGMLVIALGVVTIVRALPGGHLLGHAGPSSHTHTPAGTDSL